MRLLVLLAAATFALQGQAFQSLVTTEDGSVLYFSSEVRPRGTELSFDPKIFRWHAANGFRVAAVQSRGEFDGCRHSNFYQLRSPSVSADGSVVAYTGGREITSSRFCSPAEANQTVVTAGAREFTLDGIGAVSRNGRYAVTAPMAAVASRFHVVTDLTTGVATAVAGEFDSSWQRVTDDGAVLARERMALVLYERDGRTRLFRTRYAADDAIVNRTGRTAVYVTRFSPGGPARITSIDLQSGVETELYSGFDAHGPSISSDGTAVLLSMDRRLWLRPAAPYVGW